MTLEKPAKPVLSLRERLFASADTKKLADIIDAGIREIEEGLPAELHFGDDLADTVGRYLLDAGGKRMRPMLALLMAQFGEGTTPDVITASRAIEMTHLASLYHDDVMDEAPLRRGVESAHMRWSNSVAILTGDLLFSRASTLMSRLGVEAMSLQSQTFERLCVGQLHETTGPAAGVDPVDHYFSVLADKTGSLISAAARAGIRYSGAPAEFEEPARIFGEKIGIAFQLADDVIDLSPASDATGKKAGTDLKAGVPTLPTLLLERVVDTDPEAASLLTRLRDDAQSTDAAAEADLPEAVRALYDHPVTQTTRDEALRFAREAMEALAPLPDNAAKRALGMFADHVVSRTG